MNIDLHTKKDESNASTDYLPLLIESSVDAWAEFDPFGRYVSLNSVSATLFGLSAAEIIGRTNAELSELNPVVSRSQFTQIHLCVQETIELAQSLLATHLFSTCGGISVYETTYTPIVVNGEVVRVFSIGRNVTQRYAAATVEVSTDRPVQNELAIAPIQPIQNSPIIGVEMPKVIQPLPNEPPLVNPDTQRAEIDLQQAEKIRQSAELLRLVLDNIPQYIFWKDRNSVYLGCNRRWAEMAGIGEPDKVVGLTDYDLPWTQEQTEWYLECDRQVMETNTPMLQIKQSQLQADGKLTWRETSKLPIHDAEGHVIGILGTIEDITERVLAEDILRQSEAKFRQLAKQEEFLNQLSSQIRNSLELETILQTMVREVRQLLDTDRAVVYKFNADWQGTVVVEDVLSPWQSVLGDIGADNCFQSEYAERYCSGRVRSIDNINNAGLNDCHVQFLQQIQVQANLIVPIVTGADLWGLLIVHECRDTRQWKDWEVGLLRRLGDQAAIAIQQAQLYAQAHQNTLKAQSQTQQLEQTLYELQQTQAQLIQTEKMSSLGQLVAGVAHEINNPVNFIYGNLAYVNDYTQNLLRLIALYQHCYPDPAPKIQDEIERIDLDFLIHDLVKIMASMKVGAERIRQIVLSLRNFSRLDEADMKPVNIHDGIDSTLLILQHRLKNKHSNAGIHLVKDYGTLPLVECYAMQLNQVFMNIISNAIDALETYNSQRSVDEMRSQPSTITISTALSSDEQRVIICIRDNGSGMAEAVQRQLFNPFFTTKPIGKGTGLGLAISHQIIVDKHGGHLKCISEPGQGAEFWIEIPVRPPHADSCPSTP